MGEKKGGLFNILAVLVIAGIIIVAIWAFVPDFVESVFSKLGEGVSGVNLTPGGADNGTGGLGTGLNPGGGTGD